MTLTSNYGSGTFHGTKWYCGCGLEAVWFTSGTDNSRGETFARCPKPRDRQCRFFLAGDDEAPARVERYSEIPPAPRTPTGKQTCGPGQTLLTPSTCGGASPRRTLFKQDDTPTPQRFVPVEYEDLASVVLSRLEKDGRILRDSTELAIQQIIGDRLAGYEARLASSAKNLGRAFRKVEELERRLEIAESNT
ncbi:hypothetical protein BJ170DRAFT_638072 [Xylariales sp. AK1849]|nr:hypothetical protein BJ170DRAFT_638072 [Xylariales sp. AK1849]